MAPGKVSYPTVYVVDSQMKPPPLPPKPARRQRKDVIQTLLMILVCVALCGMAVEACFIYHLFTSKENHTSTDEMQTAMRKQDKEHTVTPKQKLLGEMKPSKPMAQLTTGEKPVNGVVLWHENHESILHHVKHNAAEGRLIIEKEGYYSVYSKISFRDDNMICIHSVLRLTHRYVGEADASEMLLRFFLILWRRIAADFDKSGL
ncbi:tumor necrosis factor ligand superfamily member 14-like protein [Labeo rohita]|uniref:Tumor necrosis factor ligand superfamily member 14-like protein n=1 Tax=Labeo rohita TaxID=84645 RepID=A0A498MMN2_LABRO|nr:tumor necrosis factor ligand superfamily member 14-like protein [Labeo rohita]RXN19946.1 tumor necrosis factor ligand superfamily member 14-like protein [Labeo rohita]